MANGLVTVCASDGVELCGVVSADLEVVDASYRQPLMRVTEFNKIYQGVKFDVEMRFDLREYRDRETQSGFLSFVDGATKFCGNVENAVFQRTRAEACATDIGDSRWVRCRAGLTQESGCAVLASIFELAGFKSNCYNSAGIYNPLIVVRLDAELESKKLALRIVPAPTLFEQGGRICPFSMYNFVRRESGASDAGAVFTDNISEVEWEDAGDDTSVDAPVRNLKTRGGGVDTMKLR